MEETNRLGEPEVASGKSLAPASPGSTWRCGDQESLWAEFLAMGLTAVDSLSKSIAVVCEGRFDVVHEVKSLERGPGSRGGPDRARVPEDPGAVRPVASDLRRVATISR